MDGLSIQAGASNPLLPDFLVSPGSQGQAGDGSHLSREQIPGLTDQRQLQETVSKATFQFPGFTEEHPALVSDS
jgi:hypothetical protein